VVGIDDDDEYDDDGGDDMVMVVVKMELIMAMVASMVDVVVEYDDE